MVIGEWQAGMKSGSEAFNSNVSSRCKRLGFLSFGHWHPHHTSLVNTGGDSLKQSIELAVAAEEIGIDGAFFRVHHYARQLASPFPLLAATAARTSRIEIGTGVIDMRYENPLYMAEEAAATDLIADGRLQLGLSRGSPETALNGAHTFGYVPADGSDDEALARDKTVQFMRAISGAPMAHADPRMGPSGVLAIQPQSPGLNRRIWWGAGSSRTVAWVAEQGMNMMSSTLLLEDTGVPFHELQAEQIRQFRAEWAKYNHGFEPRVSVSRSIQPLTSDLDRQLFARGDHLEDQVGMLEGFQSRFGRVYTGEPDEIAAELARDEAVREADTLLLTMPNQLGVDYNARMLETIATHIAPAIGWQRALVA